MMTADALRDKYLQFFASKKHKIAESDSLVPKDDPTVLFTPAGMNQFKKQFLGMITDFTRATSSQRCLRTDDLEKVGKTECHHTFFEMLGNFSFGDYFKKEAIAWAWEFLTEELAIPQEKLWVSVYTDDDEAYGIWKDVIKVPAEKICRLGDHDNFWPADAREKGPNGPCGPCSEIFFDLGRDCGCGKPGCNPGCGCGRFVEIWNLVFTQFNRKDGGVLEPLPQKNIDTGMGLERVTAVLQGVRSNFETDLFVPIIGAVKEQAVAGSPSNEDLYAIADHSRAVVFSIFDGILPSNEGRGYVVRKLIRKTVLHLQTLGIKKPFIHTLVPVICQIMAKPYPELAKRKNGISEVIIAEERNFLNTLASADALLEDRFGKAGGQIDASVAGAKAFSLYDTHGIPLLLTMQWLQKKGFRFSDKEFDAAFASAMEEQKTRSKSGSAMQGDVFSIKELALKDVPPTKFLGYEAFVCEAVVQKIIKDGAEVEQLSAGEQAKVVLDATVFYAEQGGQVGDTGVIAACGGEFAVSDTQKAEKVIVHSGMLKEGVLKKFDSAKVLVDRQRRLAVMRNHTATHLLQAALRTVLGEHVQQQGSFVAAERLRFDFTHFKQVSRQELVRIEELVNAMVMGNARVEKKEMSLQEARKEGALAFFAEKYEDRVRVVSVEGISKEFCGGTHLDATGSIGLFKIVSEGSVASGVRRIEAQTGSAAYALMREVETAAAETAAVLKTSVAALPQEVNKRLQQIKDYEKKLQQLKVEALKSGIDAWIAGAESVNGKTLVCRMVDDADMGLLRSAVDAVKEKAGSRTVVVLAARSQAEAKAVLVVGLTGDLVKEGMHAGKLVQQVAACLGGSGGGRPDFAQAGGPNLDGIDRAFAQLKSLL